MTTPTVSLSPTHALSQNNFAGSISPFLDIRSHLNCHGLNQAINKTLTSLFPQRVLAEISKNGKSNAAKILTVMNNPNLYRLPQETIDKALRSVNASRADLQNVFNTFYDIDPARQYLSADLNEHFNTQPHFKFPTIFRKFVIEKIQEEKKRSRLWINGVEVNGNPRVDLEESNDHCIQTRALYWEAYFQGKETAILYNSFLYSNGWENKTLSNDVQAIVIAAKRVPTLRKIDLSSYKWSEREFDILKQSGKIIDARGTLRTYNPKTLTIVRVALIVLLVALLVLSIYLAVLVSAVAPLALKVFYTISLIFSSGTASGCLTYCLFTKSLSRIHNCRRIYTPQRL